MKILIFGAGNSVAIHLARYVHRDGHVAVLADTDRFARGFYSRYAGSKYLFREPGEDHEGFIEDLTNCIKKEKVGLIVPASDRAMLDILGADIAMPKNVRSTFPFDRQKITYVMDKRNIPAICAKAGISTVPTCIVGSELIHEETARKCMETLSPPYALKPARGQTGRGFLKVEHKEELRSALNRTGSDLTEKDYLVQDYIEGKIYGAGALVEENSLKHFYSYRYIRRYPDSYGWPTICQVDLNVNIREAMVKALAALEWNGFCQMDFIIDRRTGVPFLIDINPVHWYSVPKSQAKEFNSLSYYLDGERRDQNGPVQVEGRHETTVWLRKELQRVAVGLFSPCRHAPTEDHYWKYIRGLQCSDFYWDPLPIVLAPLLRFLRLWAR